MTSDYDDGRHGMGEAYPDLYTEAKARLARFGLDEKIRELAHGDPELELWLEIKELADGSQVVEAAAKRARSQTLEAVSKAQTRGDGVQGNLNARHDDLLCGICRGCL